MIIVRIGKDRTIPSNKKKKEEKKGEKKNQRALNTL